MSNKILEINKKISEFETKKIYSKETEENVSKIDQCPTCLQNVSEQHKKAIHEKEHSLIKEMDEGIKLQKEHEADAKNKVEHLNKLQEELRKKQIEIKAVIVKKDLINEKEKKKRDIQAQQDRLKQEIGKISMKRIELNKKIHEL